jgi:hypothetical protein
VTFRFRQFINYIASKKKSNPKVIAPQVLVPQIKKDNTEKEDLAEYSAR